ncbi:MAG: hypothetical protein WBY66_03450, partial [Candidatus Acidiferrales bacterium]
MAAVLLSVCNFLNQNLALSPDAGAFVKLRAAHRFGAGITPALAGFLLEAGRCVIWCWTENV